MAAAVRIERTEINVQFVESELDDQKLKLLNKVISDWTKKEEELDRVLSFFEIPQSVASEIFAVVD